MNAAKPPIIKMFYYYFGFLLRFLQLRLGQEGLKQNLCGLVFL